MLHGKGNPISGDLWIVTGEEPVLMPKDELIKLNYPKIPSRDYYLVYKISPVDKTEFGNCSWDINKLDGYSTGYGSTRPFAIGMNELMLVKTNVE